MKLLVIRHGESEADILNVHEGRADFELTERGHRQAEAMSEYVSENYQIAKISQYAETCRTDRKAFGGKNGGRADPR